MASPDSEMLINSFTKLKLSAAIHGKDGTEWATTSEFKISDEEVQSIIAALDKDATKRPKGDISIAGKKAEIVNRDDVSIAGLRDGGFFSVRTTHKALVVGCWSKETVTMARGAEKVDNAADFLMNEGY